MAWPLTDKDIKRYPHFDAQMPLSELQRLATSPSEVARHAFFPFLKYEKRWKPFRRPLSPPKAKIRPIRYACRRDSAIFSYYRYVLSENYEVELIRRGIQSAPIAYRRLLGTGRGKCNIDFAAAAFADVRRLKNCCVVTLDISSFFESVDHKFLRAMWCRLIGTAKLPPDHQAVFRAITKYAVVDRTSAYERLGYFGGKLDRNGRQTCGYLRLRKDMPVQLCSPADFRRLVCGGNGGGPSLIETNQKPYGIPQGAPISDLLANAYLVDFDDSIFRYVSDRGGVYYRYSDDIFILVPGNEAEGRAAEAFASAALATFGSELRINPKKTAMTVFTENGAGELTSARLGRPASDGGLEYLGFRFNGRSTYIRESTMSKFHRGIRRAARHRAIQLVRRYPGRNEDFLIQAFNIPAFEARFGRVADFERSLAYRRWTFRTYVKRCVDVFGEEGTRFLHQTRRHREFVRSAATDALRSALARLQ